MKGIFSNPAQVATAAPGKTSVLQPTPVPVVQAPLNGPMDDSVLIDIAAIQLREQQARDAVEQATRRKLEPISSAKLTALSAEAKRLGRPLLEKEIAKILA